MGITGTKSPGSTRVPRSGGRMGWFGRLALIAGVVVTAAVVAVVASLAWWFAPHTWTWTEEAALQDGRIVVVSRKTTMEREGFDRIEGWRELRFTHPDTGKVITWTNAGTVGSRLRLMLLDVDQGQVYLVTTAQVVRDYDELGCPTPPYLVFRYDTAGWTRIPLADLPGRLENANLMGDVNVARIKEAQYALTAAQVADVWSELRERKDTRYYAVIDRRLRNPIGLGCSRGTVERVYGSTKYLEWLKTGNWLDKSADEVAKLLGTKGKGGSR